MPKREYSPEDVFNVIVNGNSKTRFKVTLVAVGGLPGSGKSTLVNKLVPEAVQSVQALRMHEVAYCSRSRREKLAPEWGLFPRDSIYMFMLTRALTDNGQALPLLKLWAGNGLPKICLTDRQLYNHFEKIYCDMQVGLLEFAKSESDFRYHVMTQPNYVFLNLFDIGVSKALNESLPLISRLMQPFVLLNVLNLHRDSLKKLRNLPELTNAHKAQKVMIGRSRGHYYTRINRLCKEPGQIILIGTHKDKLKERDAPVRIQKLTEAGIRAKIGDMGASKSMIESQMLAVNLHNEKDVENIKRHIEEVINSTDAFDHDLHLTWIFLRSALVHYTYPKSEFRMPLEYFHNLARQCGLKASEDIEKCLKFFTKIGSLMHNKEFFGDNVIYRPDIFFKKLNDLYDPKHRKDQHYEETLSMGILCKKVAEKIWGEDTDFFWELTLKAGVAVAISDPDNDCDYGIRCPHSGCQEKDLLFVSTLRIERYERKEGMKEDSLYIIFNSQYMPGDIQVQFVKHIKLEIPEIKLKQTKQYNLIEFELPKGGSLQIIVHGDVVELAVEGYKDNDKLESETKNIIKTTCVKIMDSILKYFPGFEYQLGLLCKECLKLSDTDPAPNNNITCYCHILPTDPPENELYCKVLGSRTFQERGSEEVTHKLGCGKMMQLSAGQKCWMTLNGKVGCLLDLMHGENK